MPGYVPNGWFDGRGRGTTLYILYNEDRSAGEATPIREATREAHLAYLERHKNIVVLAGGTLSEDGATRTGSVFIINAPNRQAAEKFSAEEPFRKAGLFKTVRITRMRRGQWNPEAAPKTAEGN
jgi:uncharacterized protein YciI